MALLSDFSVTLPRTTFLQRFEQTLDRNAVIIIAIVSVVSSLIAYLPFLISGEMDSIFRHWDGPNYAYLAKSLYDVPVNHPLNAYTTPSYFAAHLPVYPLSIRVFSFLGYFNSMLFTTVLYATLAAIVFYHLLKETGVVKSPLWSAILSLYIPVRYLLNHSIGATEAPFLFFTLSSLLAYVRGNYLLAFLLGGISGITRITGILIGCAYFMALVTERKWKYIPALALIALPLFLTFTFYHFHYGDFFAYLGTNYSSSNKLIYFTPVKIFQYYAGAGKTHSAEFYLIMYAVYGLGTAILWSKNRLFFWYCLFGFTFSIFIFHQDVSRYLIPLAPLAIVVAYDDVLSRPACKWVFLPALALSYIYVWGIIPHNNVDKRTYMKLQSELKETFEEKKISAAFGSLVVEACSYKQCESSIKTTNGSKLITTRGLNIFRYMKNGEVVYVESLDHCVNNRIYEQSKPLQEKIASFPRGTEKVVLLSNDTINCSNQSSIPGMSRWVQGTKLNKIETLKLRDTYIAVIDVKTGELVESKDKETQQFPY